MDDLFGVDAHGIQAPLAGHRRQPPVFRMGFVEVIGDAPPQTVELDTGTHHIARRQFSVEIDRQVLCLEQLQLQRHNQTILWPAGTQTNKAFAPFEHGPTCQRLQTVEVGLTGGIGLCSPITPQCLHFSFEALVAGQTLRLDASADRIGDKCLDSRLCPGIAPHQVAALDTQVVAGGQ